MASQIVAVPSRHTSGPKLGRPPAPTPPYFFPVVPNSAQLCPDAIFHQLFQFTPPGQSAIRPTTGQLATTANAVVDASNTLANCSNGRLSTIVPAAAISPAPDSNEHNHTRFLKNPSRCHRPPKTCSPR